LALGVALAMLTILTLKFPHLFRAMLAVSLLANLPTFRRSTMRQRLILVWVTGALGSVVEALFLDAPWLYVPSYMLLIFGTMALASRSRDAATMTLLVYGLSGSLISGKIADSAPIMGGFYRTLAVTIGIFAAAAAFSIIPLRKGYRPQLPEPVNFRSRETFFLGFVGVFCLVLGHTLVTDNRIFVIMGGLPWAIQLLSAPFSVLRVRLIGAVLGTLIAIFTLSVLSASTNNVAIYVTVISLIMGTIGYLGYTFPLLKPGCAQFAVSFMLPAGMLPGPTLNFHLLFSIVESMWLGIIIASLLYFLHEWLLRIEKTVEDSGPEDNGYSSSHSGSCDSSAGSNAR
jgi:hypothetical protein